MGVALPQELLDRDGVADGLPGGGQVAVEFDGRVEQAVGAAAAHDEVDPEPGREEEVGLAGLDRDAHRRPAAVEVPRVGQDVVLGDDAPRPEAPLVPVDLQDAVDQHERLVRQPDARGEGVHLRELRAQHPGGRPACELEALGAVIGRRRRKASDSSGGRRCPPRSSSCRCTSSARAQVRVSSAEISRKAACARAVASEAAASPAAAARNPVAAAGGGGSEGSRGAEVNSAGAGGRRSGRPALATRIRACGSEGSAARASLSGTAAGRSSMARCEPPSAVSAPASAKRTAAGASCSRSAAATTAASPPAAPQSPASARRSSPGAPARVPPAVGDANAYRGLFQPGFGQRRRRGVRGAVEAGRARGRARPRGCGRRPPRRGRAASAPAATAPSAGRHRRPIRVGALPQERAAQIAAEVDGADQRAVQLTGPDGARADLERREAGGRRGGDDEARPSQAEFAGDAAGHHAAERAQHAGGGERRCAGVHGLSEPAIDGRGVRVREARRAPIRGRPAQDASAGGNRSPRSRSRSRSPPPCAAGPARSGSLAACMASAATCSMSRCWGRMSGISDRRDAEAAGCRRSPRRCRRPRGPPGPAGARRRLSSGRRAGTRSGSALPGAPPRTRRRPSAGPRRMAMPVTATGCSRTGSAGHRSGRQRERQLGLRRPRAAPATGRPILGRPLLEQEVGVDAAEAEGAHRRAGAAARRSAPTRLGSVRTRSAPSCERAAVRGR